MKINSIQSTLIILGVIILIGTFLAGNYYTLQQQSEMQLKGDLCNTNLGNIFSGFSDNVAKECESINNTNFLLSLVPIGYLLGIALVIGGIAIPIIKK
ncbi:MAG: hypothetical protein PHX27_03555 [Candidatus ainarchaeum sp.]|nr:hypothetical protein [Candidatus ainarchaeum sp.]